MSPEWTRTVRTVLQVTLSIAAAAPLVVPAMGLSTAAGVGAVVVGVAATVTRVSQIPAVASLLERFLKVPQPK